jgi:L-alanine-DL-glutamate epimerase-like enolase superfamily enzyme
LEGWQSPIPLCADELVDTSDDLERVLGRFDVVNIKLDKAGGLTEALEMADAAEALGLRLMVGCMAGSSLAMAPALLLASRCEFVDLDGPLLQQTDVSPGLHYDDGRIGKPSPGLWG